MRVIYYFFTWRYIKRYHTLSFGQVRKLKIIQYVSMSIFYVSTVAILVTYWAEVKSVPIVFLWTWEEIISFVLEIISNEGFDYRVLDQNIRKRKKDNSRRTSLVKSKDEKDSV